MSHLDFTDAALDHWSVLVQNVGGRGGCKMSHLDFTDAALDQWSVLTERPVVDSE